MPTVDLTLASPTLDVVPWDDPVIDALGHPPRSTYVERFWLSILGPTATWLVRHLDARLEAGGGAATVDLAATAEALGLGGGTGRNSPVVRSLARCHQFGIVRGSTRPGPRRRHRRPPRPARRSPATRSAACPLGPPGRARRLARHRARRRHPRRTATAGPPGRPGPGRAGRGRAHHRAAAPRLADPPGGGPGVRGVGPPPGRRPRRGPGDPARRRPIRATRRLPCPAATRPDPGSQDPRRWRRVGTTIRSHAGGACGGTWSRARGGGPSPWARSGHPHGHRSGPRSVPSVSVRPFGRLPREHDHG